MLLVDTAEVSAEGEAKGTYTVRGDEWFLRDISRKPGGAGGYTLRDNGPDLLRAYRQHGQHRGKDALFHGDRRREVQIPVQAGRQAGHHVPD